MGYSGAGGKLIHEKNQKQKIWWHCPFKAILDLFVFLKYSIYLLIGCLTLEKIAVFWKKKNWRKILFYFYCEEEVLELFWSATLLARQLVL